MTVTTPRFPLFIPSKGRADIALTPRALDRMGVPYRLVVEESERPEYAKHFPEDRLLVLDPSYQDEYVTCDEYGGDRSRGSGPARNFIWDTAIREGHPWHWIMDDNIERFARLHRNERVPVGDGTLFHAMETFCLRYRNVAMAGPQYWMFAPSRERIPAFVTGTRIFSCNLIRCDVPYRWRGRYNEDLDLSLRMLKDGWATVLFNAFLQVKMTTQKMRGGNTDTVYAKGTEEKSRMIVRLHPDVAKLSWKFGRAHHHVNFNQWLGQSLVRWEDDAQVDEPDYRMVRVHKTTQV